MRPRSFILLAALTGLVSAGAVGSLIWDRPAPLDPTQSRYMFPGLLDRVNEIDYVEVSTSADGTITARRRDGAWGIEQRQGYPANFETLRGMLVDLARVELIEPRTDKPALYRKLQVEDQADERSTSIRITARIGDETIADLLVGRTRPADSGGGVFVRRAGDAQAWLARGSFQPVRLLARLLDRDILNVEQRRIHRVTLAHRDGETVTVEKADPADAEWRLATPPGEGREAREAHELSALASWLDFLILDDVRPAEGLDASDPLVTGRFESFDGIAVEARMVEQDGERWILVDAAPGPVHPAAAALLDERKKADPAPASGSIATAMRTPAEIEAEIAEIARVTGGWAYRATDYKMGKLATRLSGVTQPKTEDDGDKAAQSGG